MACIISIDLVLMYIFLTSIVAILVFCRILDTFIAGHGRNCGYIIAKARKSYIEYYITCCEGFRNASFWLPLGMRTCDAGILAWLAQKPARKRSWWEWAPNFVTCPFHGRRCMGASNLCLRTWKDRVDPPAKI